MSCWLIASTFSDSLQMGNISSSRPLLSFPFVYRIICRVELSVDIFKSSMDLHVMIMANITLF
jgi:hypothetical protein